MSPRFRSCYCFSSSAPPACSAPQNKEPTMDIHKIDWSAIPWKEIRKGVEQKAFSGNAATVALHRLMPGHEPRPHSHPHEQIAYIIEGRMMFYIGEERAEAGRGGVVVTPGGVEQGGGGLGDEPVLNLDVF